MAIPMDITPNCTPKSLSKIEPIFFHRGRLHANLCHITLHHFQSRDCRFQRCCRWPSSFALPQGSWKSRNFINDQYLVCRVLNMYNQIDFRSKTVRNAAVHYHSPGLKPSCTTVPTVRAAGSSLNLEGSWARYISRVHKTHSMKEHY